MMVSKWRVTSNIVGGQERFWVYRLKDINAVDHSGNREYYGGYFGYREAAEQLVAYLNGTEEESGNALQGDRKMSELMEAAMIIKNHCEEFKDCADCFFGKNGKFVECLLERDPCEWSLQEVEK